MLQDDGEIGRIAILAYRCLVRTGFETCRKVAAEDVGEMSKNAVYDSSDYRAAYLQVLRMQSFLSKISLTCLIIDMI